MADDNKQGGAQSKLGELFIDIGSSGLGTLVKGLNTVSASFLLTKNAATQALKPIISMSQKGGNTVTTLDKLSSVTGLTSEQLQKLQIQATLSNTSFEELTGQIQVFQKTLQDVLLKGKGNNEGFAWLGLSPRDFDPSKPLEALDKISQRVMQLRPEVAAYALDELGISRDLIYYWQQGNKEVDKRLLLNEKELDSLRRQQDAWNNLRITTSQTTNKLAADIPAITEGINGLANSILKVAGYITNVLVPAWNNINKINPFKKLDEAYNKTLKEHGQKPASMVDAAPNKLIWTLIDKGLKKLAGYKEPVKKTKAQPIKAAVKSNNTAASIPTGSLQSQITPLTDRQKKLINENLEEIPDSEIEAQGYSLANIPLPPTSSTNNHVINNNVNVSVNQRITSPDPQTAAQASYELIDTEINNNMIERANLGNR